jgi:ferredoxin-nitrite reductase
MQTGSNGVEATKASVAGDGLHIREQLPRLIAQGYGSLSTSEKDLLKWVGVFFRKPTPGKFMMRVRMPNGFTSSCQLRALADLHAVWGIACWTSPLGNKFNYGGSS